MLRCLKKTRQYRTISVIIRVMVYWISIFKNSIISCISCQKKMLRVTKVLDGKTKKSIFFLALGYLYDNFGVYGIILR